MAEPALAPRLFSGSYYLKRHPEVKDAGVTPWEHFRTVGWRKGYDPHPLFDVKWYLDRYFKAATGEMDPLTHYLGVGFKNGYNPHPDFDGAWYRSHYEDIGRAQLEPLHHFVFRRLSEGRRLILRGGPHR